MWAPECPTALPLSLSNLGQSATLPGLLDLWALNHVLLLLSLFPKEEVLGLMKGRGLCLERGQQFRVRAEWEVGGTEGSEMLSLPGSIWVIPGAGDPAPKLFGSSWGEVGENVLGLAAPCFVTCCSVY